MQGCHIADMINQLSGYGIRTREESGAVNRGAPPGRPISVDDKNLSPAKHNKSALLDQFLGFTSLSSVSISSFRSLYPSSQASNWDCGHCLIISKNCLYPFDKTCKFHFYRLVVQFTNLVN
ncbi:hypothetical protein L6164_010848 [Bauhinia variegata]|uniref:Uncharacterized protein n=1 Tax=Bauhinia variegata TaxID=167791 RepID=A0ACB9P419_BAUVA|nr:hypothetical protein L6164_010848 [Bauhinia variegata]